MTARLKGPPTARFNLAPAWEAAGNPSVQDMANRCGVNHRTVTRWRATGHVSHRTADLIATRLGTHPTLIWPEWGDTDD